MSSKSEIKPHHCGKLQPSGVARGSWIGTSARAGELTLNEADPDVEAAQASASRSWAEGIARSGAGFGPVASTHNRSSVVVTLITDQPMLEAECSEPPPARRPAGSRSGRPGSNRIDTWTSTAASSKTTTTRRTPWWKSALVAWPAAWLARYRAITMMPLAKMEAHVRGEQQERLEDPTVGSPDRRGSGWRRPAGGTSEMAMATWGTVSDRSGPASATAAERPGGQGRDSDRRAGGAAWPATGRSARPPPGRAREAEKLSSIPRSPRRPRRRAAAGTSPRLAWSVRMTPSTTPRIGVDQRGDDHGPDHRGRGSRDHPRCRDHWWRGAARSESGSGAGEAVLWLAPSKKTLSCNCMMSAGVSLVVTAFLVPVNRGRGAATIKTRPGVRRRQGPRRQGTGRSASR